MTDETKRIAVLAGDGYLPVLLVIRLMEINLISLIIVLQGKSERFGFTEDKIFEIPPGKLEKTLSILEENRIDKVIMIGKIDKQGFIERKGFDLKAVELLKRLNDGKDLSIFHLILEEFKNIGIEVLPQDLYLKDMLINKGLLTDRNPTEGELEDASFGMEYAKDIATMEIGQTVIIKNKTVIAVEAIEGTNETIKRGGTYGKERSVVCKASRYNQDRRFDIPAIGRETIEMMADHGCSLLAAEAGMIFIANRNEVIDLANRRGISIIGV